MLSEELQMWVGECISITGVSIALSVWVICRFIFRSNKFDAFILTNKLFQWSFFTMLVSLLYISIDLYRLVSYYIKNDDSVAIDAGNAVLVVLNASLYYVATLSLYICLILRAYLFFRNTIYAINKQKFRLFISFIVIDMGAISLLIFASYVVVYEKSEQFGLNKNAITMTVVLSAITIILTDIVINGTLLYIFLNNLYKMIIDAEQTFRKLTNFITYNSTSVKNGGDSKSMRLSTVSNEDNETIKLELRRNANQQKEFVVLMTRLSILTMAAIVFEQGYTICSAYELYQIKILKNDNTESLVILSYMSRSIEAVFNCVALYFSFIFNQNEYLQWCFCCHNCLNNLCKTCIAKKIIRNVEQAPLVENPTSDEWRL